MLLPPNFPDVVHVANGCYVSALAYTARFRAVHPAERAETATVVLPNADGSFKPHTVAIVSWHGQWWARDEYYGLANLRAPSSRPWDASAVARSANDTYRQRAGWLQAAGLRRMADQAPSGAGAYPWRMEQINAARQLLPISSEVIWLRTRSGTLPFLFFRPAQNGAFAVYDPNFGTAQATAQVNDPHQLVAAVAARLGYVAPRIDDEADRLVAAAPRSRGPDAVSPKAALRTSLHDAAAAVAPPERHRA